MRPLQAMAEGRKTPPKDNESNWYPWAFHLNSDHQTSPKNL